MTACEKMKDGTKILHHQLDRTPLLLCLARGEFDLEDYQRSIAAFSICYRYIEAKIENRALRMLPCPKPDYRSRLPWLQQDSNLQCWQSKKESKHGCSLSRLASDKSVYWGARYVLDGSAMGAKVLVEPINKRLKILSRPNSIFWSKQAELAEQWFQIREIINRELTSVQEIQLATTVARETFQIFLDAFSFDKTKHLKIRANC